MEESKTIKIEVVDPVNKQNKYIQYTVKGVDRNGEFEVFRRYSDFVLLRESLLKRWPGVYIPPIPSKKAIGAKEQKFLEERREFLQFFCIYVGEKLDHLFYSEEFQLFIREKNPDLEKAFNSLPKCGVEEILEKFNQTFISLKDQVIDTAIMMKITTFRNFLKKAEATLENLKKFVYSIVEAQENFNKNFSETTEKLIPDYEQNAIMEYSNQNEASSVFLTNKEVQESASELRSNTKASYQKLLEIIKIELKEVKAFQEVLGQKDHYDSLKSKQKSKLEDEQKEVSKLHAGKTTLKSFFSKGGKEEQIAKLDQQIIKSQKESDDLTMLVDLITIILGYKEIDRFKDDKSQRYYEVLIEVALLEKEYSERQVKLWKSVETANNIA